MATLAEALQQHEEQLTDLYGQLDGNPAPTVCKRLEELHAKLVDTIGSQRVQAQTEVADVKRECLELEEQLGRIAKVLGKRLAQDPDSDVCVNSSPCFADMESSPA